MHNGRGEYQTTEAILHTENKFNRILNELIEKRQTPCADEVYIPPEVAYDTAGWQIGNQYKKLTDCSHYELETVTRRLFTRCQVLQQLVDELERERLTKEERKAQRANLDNLITQLR